MKEHTGTFIEIEKSLYKGIKDYCEFNDLKPTVFINELLQKAFMREKYGDAPPFFKQKAVVDPIPEEENKVIEIKPEIKPVEVSETPKTEITTPKGKKKVKVY